MKHTERIERINANLNQHFKSNHSAYWVNNEPYTNPDIITLHRGIGGDRINAMWVVLYIFRTEPTVRQIRSLFWIYTRETLRRAGYKI